MNVKQDSRKIGLDTFNVRNLSGPNRNQLLKSVTINLDNEIKPLPLIDKPKINQNPFDSLLDHLKFSNDVVVDRCVYLLPYDEGFYRSVYKYKPAPKKTRDKPLTSGVINNHACISDFRRNKVPFEDDKKTSMKTLERKVDKKYEESVENPSTMSTRPEYTNKYWDEYLISLVSKNTAQYLAYDLTHDEQQASRLKKLVDGWYGLPPAFRELVPDEEREMVESQQKDDPKSIFPYKYYMDLIRATDKSMESARPVLELEQSPRKKIQMLREREQTLHSQDQTDPYGNETKASFYRLPVVIRRTKRPSRDLKLASTNRTTETLKEFKLPITPPRVVNRKIGDKVLSTDNEFQQEIFLDQGKHQVKQLSLPEDIICVDTKLYRKTLQPIWPADTSSGLPTQEYLDCSQPTMKKVIRGHNRWEKLPQLYQEDLIQSKGESDNENMERQKSQKRARDNTSLNLLVDQWRKKWQLTQKFSDSTTEELLQDMVDVHPTVRLQAIVTCAKAASMIHLQKHGSAEPAQETINAEELPSVMIDALHILLDDRHFQVRKAAAIALHSLEKPSDKSLAILRSLLKSESSVDRWVAVQCLSLSKECDGEVISELVSQLMNSEDVLVHKKATVLLTKISHTTKLAHGILGERLNTSSWRHRVITCQTIALLNGPLNKDLMRKLIYVMWNDPHKQVRIAASQALGKTGNGKAVHDELICKLQNESELIRADALEKIGILKVLTTRMMASFMKCFSDEFVMVRKEICRTCYRLQIQDQICTNELVRLAQYDPLWKIKVSAIRALGQVRQPNAKIKSCLLWALQFETETKLRLEAIRAISSSITLDDEVIEAIKSRYLVEKDETIFRIMRELLLKVNINVNIDIEMVAEIKAEVQKCLSDRRHITDVILYNEAVEDYEHMKSKLIADNEVIQNLQVPQINDEDNPEELDEIDIIEQINQEEIIPCKDSDDKEDENEIFSEKPPGDQEIREAQISEIPNETAGQSEEVLNSKFDSLGVIMEEDNEESYTSRELTAATTTDSATVHLEEQTLLEEEDKVSKDLLKEKNELSKKVSFVSDGWIEEDGSSIQSPSIDSSSHNEKEITLNEKFFDSLDMSDQDKTMASSEDDESLEQAISFVTDIPEEKDPDNVDDMAMEDIVENSSQISSPLNEFQEANEILEPTCVSCGYNLPKNLDDIDTSQRSRAMMSFDDSNIQFLEASLNQDILDQVYQAIGEEGIDFGPLEHIL